MRIAEIKVPSIGVDKGMTLAQWRKTINTLIQQWGPDAKLKGPTGYYNVCMQLVVDEATAKAGGTPAFVSYHKQRKLKKRAAKR